MGNLIFAISYGTYKNAFSAHRTLKKYYKILFEYALFSISDKNFVNFFNSQFALNSLLGHTLRAHVNKPLIQVSFGFTQFMLKKYNIKAWKTSDRLLVVTPAHVL